MVNMEIDCPQGWKSVFWTGHIMWEDSRVNIYEGICDSADLCKINTCPYFDLSPEATQIFLQASAYEATLEGFLESKKSKQRHLQPRRYRMQTRESLNIHQNSIGENGRG